MVYWGLFGRCPQKNTDYCFVTLKSVGIKVTVRGFTARVNASLTYQNDTEDPLEVEYKMPVDEGAAVYKFEAVVDGRKISAQCMEKKKAEKVYKEAVQSGLTALLGREDDLLSDIFHMALGNLLPGTKAELQLNMIMELKVKTDGAVNFTLPTVLNPRYCPANVKPDQHTKSVAQNLGRETIVVSEAYTFGIEASVQGGHAIARIVSHNDSLDVKISDDNMSAEITQDGGGFKPDHDWNMLLYYVNPYKTHLIRETGDRSSTGLMKDDLVMINLHPELSEQSYSNKNEIIFVVDRSGSMQGEKMQSARATLLLFLKSLPAGCYFNIISFGSDHALLFPRGSEKYSEETLQKACQLHARMSADMGGTEILKPLQKIYSKPPLEGYARQILLLTDGQVFNVDMVKDLVSRNAHETHVFAVGIGHGASTALVNGLARAGRGRAEMVYQQDKLQMKVMGLVRSMLQDTVQDVKVNFTVDPPGGIKLVPKVPPVIYGGQHLVLYARVPQETNVKGIAITGVIGDAVYESRVEGSDVVTVHDEEMTLHRLAARAQINEWQIDNEEDVAEDMIALSLSSGVVCRRTALVGVDQDMKPLTNNLTSTAVPQQAVHGVRKKCASTSAPLPPLSRMSLLCYRSGGMPRAASAMKSSSSRYKFSAKSTRSSAIPSPPPLEPQALSAIDDAQEAPVNLTATKSSTKQESPLMEVVSLQKFNGSWTLADAARLTSLPLSRLSEASTAKNEDSWATALILCLLEMKHSEEEDQWVLLAIKAKLFITECGDDVKALMAAAKTLLSSA